MRSLKHTVRRLRRHLLAAEPREPPPWLKMHPERSAPLMGALREGAGRLPSDSPPRPVASHRP